MNHFLMLNMTIHVNQLMKCIISIKFKFQIQFVMFRRGHPGTPIDPASVLLSGKHCPTSQVMLGPAVIRQPGFRRGTRRAKQRRENNPVGWLAGCLAGWLATGWLAGYMPGCLADWLAG